MNAPKRPGQSKDPFVALGKIVLGEQPLPQILEQVVRLSKQVVPARVESSITLITDGAARTPAYTRELALALDERQYEDDTGPCLHAARSNDTVLIRDIRSEARWPLYSEAAAAKGVLSSLSVPLPMGPQVTGALNFYASVREAFDPEAIDLAETFAGHATVAVVNAYLFESTARLAEQMQQAMATRAVIEQAKGIIMRDRACSADEAFSFLVTLSQTTHVKLRDVARQLVDSVTDEGHGAVT